MSLREIEKEQRFTKLYEAYIDEVYQFISARSGFDRAISEDITQDVFMNILKGLDRFRGLCSERTWVFKIARNKLNDFYRKQYGQKVETCDMSGVDQLYDPAQDSGMWIEQPFESQLIRQCLDRLPLHYRMALLMKYVDGKSIKQIAKTTAKPLKATESMLHRARGAFIREYQLIIEREG